MNVSVCECVCVLVLCCCLFKIFSYLYIELNRLEATCTAEECEATFLSRTLLRLDRYFDKKRPLMLRTCKCKS